MESKVTLENALSEFGLTDKETKIYLVLLQIGSVKLQEVARRVNFPRTTVFNTLNYLIAKNLVSKTTKKNVIHYQATDPSKLQDILDKKKRLIDSVLPQLQQLKGLITDTTHVEVFEGPHGAYSIYMDVFKDYEMKYYFGNYKNLIEIMKHLVPNARQVRIDKKIPAKVMCEPVDEPVFHTKEYKSITEMRQTPLLNDFPGYIFIYGGGKKMAMFTNQKEVVGLVIKNEQITTMMKMMFDVYWKAGKPFKL